MTKDQIIDLILNRMSSGELIPEFVLMDLLRDLSKEQLEHLVDTYNLGGLKNV
jgi:hypothetical protein